MLKWFSREKKSAPIVESPPTPEPEIAVEADEFEPPATATDVSRTEPPDEPAGEVGTDHPDPGVSVDDFAALMGVDLEAEAVLDDEEIEEVTSTADFSGFEPSLLDEIPVSPSSEPDRAPPLGVDRETAPTGDEDARASADATATVALGEPEGFLARLTNRLTKTRGSLIDRLRAAIRLHGKLDDELFEEVEDILLQSDVGMQTTMKITERMRKAARGQGATDGEALIELFKDSIREILLEGNRGLDFDRTHPTIVLVVGVNGTGKTTTIGKIGKVLADRDKRVMMVAADTFRAAAADQLQIWAERTGSGIVRREEGADPAAVVFEAMEGARRDGADVILIDTAGRLHNKKHLMEELAKIVRVIRKHFPDAPHETVLVLDATTGQNALNQVQIFNKVCRLTGLVMTKLDGTAKGGILIACKDVFNLPIFKIGVGEGVEDLRDFDPAQYVEALFSTDTAERRSRDDARAGDAG